MSLELYSIDELYLYSRCPRLYWNKQLLNTSVKTELEYVVSFCISKTLVSTLDAKQLVDWRRILGWANKEVFKNVNLTDSSALDNAKKRIGPILDVLYSWYHLFYRKEQLGGLDHIYIKAKVSLEIEAGGIIPIVKLSEVPSVVTVSTSKLSPFEISRDMKSHFRAFLLARSLDLSEVTIDYYFCGTNGALTNFKKSISSKDLNRIENYIASLSRSIKAKNNYPVFTAGCSKCPLYKQCIL